MSLPCTGLPLLSFEFKWLQHVPVEAQMSTRQGITTLTYVHNVPLLCRPRGRDSKHQQVECKQTRPRQHGRTQRPVGVQATRRGGERRGTEQGRTRTEQTKNSCQRQRAGYCLGTYLFHLHSLQYFPSTPNLHYSHFSLQ